jgi:hypothetical protein
VPSRSHKTHLTLDCTKLHETVGRTWLPVPCVVDWRGNVYTKWSQQSPHHLDEWTLRDCTKCRHLAIIAGRYVTGPYQVSVQPCTISLEQERNLLNVLDGMWFQHDDALAHFPDQVNTWSSNYFPGTWIGHRDPPSSPDPDIPQFLLWVCIRRNVHAMKFIKTDWWMAWRPDNCDRHAACPYHSSGC